MPEINEEEVKAMALLLERSFGFDQFAMIRAYQTDSWNLFDANGSYEGGGMPEGWSSTDVEKDGIEHRGFLVHYDINCDVTPETFTEKAFKTAEEAARFYIAYKNEHKLD